MCEVSVVRIYPQKFIISSYPAMHIHVYICTSNVRIIVLEVVASAV